MDQIFTVQEVAKIIKINYRKVLDEIMIGNLMAFKIGRQYRISESQLLTYLNKQEF